MNILTFDIEDWYNCDFISGDFDWSKYEVRIYEGVYRILDELDRQNQKATFFCLGWLAEYHPDVIKEIDRRGHHIGCHSYQHELSFRFNYEQFVEDTSKSKKLIESIIGKPVTAFRAPGFSITEKNLWALDALVEMGFEYDCSIFPAHHDYGGMPRYGQAEPALLRTSKGYVIKEFPINIHTILGHNIVFSGGGFFRLFPYWLIKKWSAKSRYLMVYLHPRDFDTGQPIIKTLPLMRKFKSYVGIAGAFNKFRRYIEDYHFVNILEADKQIDWSKQRIIQL